MLQMVLNVSWLQSAQNLVTKPWDLWNWVISTYFQLVSKQPVVSQGLLVKTFIESVLWLGKCISLLMCCQQVLYLFINHLMSAHLIIHHLFSVKYESLHSPNTHEL